MVTYSETLIKLAVHEQLALPGLDHVGGREAAAVVKEANASLARVRGNVQNEADVNHLGEWHQAYHLFRFSAGLFVRGVAAFKTDRFEEALDLFTEAYRISVRIMENPPRVRSSVQPV